MKKLVKCLVAVGAMIGGVAGVLYFLDKKKGEEAFDDFDDTEFDDVFDDEEEEEDNRDYVTLDFEDETEEEQ